MNQQEASQDVLRCDVCFDKEREKSPAEVHCNTCHTNVCGPCVAKHMTSNKSKKHDIVLLFSANTDIDLPGCPFHSTVKCELFCRRCIIPICLKCLISNHDGHGVEEIIELCKPICADIQKNTDNLKNKIIPKFEKLLVDEDEKLKRLIQEYDSFESSVEDHGQEIHKAVDAVIKKYKANELKGQREKNLKFMEKVDNKLLQMKKDMQKLLKHNDEVKQTDVQILQQQKKEINELLSEVKQDAAHNDLLQRSRNVTELMAYEAKPTIDPILKIIIPPVFKPKLVSDDVLEGFFTPIPNSKVVVEEEPHTVDENKKLSAIGKLTDKPLFTFHTPFKQLLRVSCTRYGRLWTSGNDNMLRSLDMQNWSVVDSRTIPSNRIRLTYVQMTICLR